MAEHTTDPVGQVLRVLHEYGRPARLVEIMLFCCCEAHTRLGLSLAKKHCRVTWRSRGFGTEYAPTPPKDRDDEDKKQALAVTRFVLRELSKVIAPTMPFYAEFLYQEIREKDSSESVHLESWPKSSKIDKDIITSMQKTRDVVSLALEARSKAGIKTRQPLGKLTISIDLEEEFCELIKEEVNVKEVVLDGKIKDNVLLDTELNKELKEEGFVRDIVRHLQDLRKKEGLTPSDIVSISIDVDKEGQDIINKYVDSIKNTASVENIIFENNSGEELVLDSHKVAISLEKKL